MRVLHSTHDNGPKLVEMTDDAELNLRAEIPGLKVVPVVEFKKMSIVYRVEQRATLLSGKVPQEIKVSIVDKDTGRPVAGASVHAFTNFADREGASGVSHKNGSVALKLKSGSQLERLYVYGPAGYWGHYAIKTSLKNGDALKLPGIDLQNKAALLPGFYGSLPLDAGKDVTVAVIDSGVADAHPGLPNAKGGLNLVYEETDNNVGATTEWGPAKKDGEHGTHVAGIIGANPTAGAKIRGVAPGVQLRSYRVFPHSGGNATNYDIMNAIDRAVLDGCDIINLSLGGGPEDEPIRAAIGKALDAGVLVVAAAGNGGRSSVSYPAALTSCVSVSAMGRRSTFPKHSTEESDVAKPFGKPDDDAFVAAFSNIGPQIDVTGPGVGVVSTVPDHAYGVMSGTSMATPAVSGLAAYLLASTPTIMNAKNAERSKLLKEALFTSCRKLGFGRDYEGFGLPSV